MYKLTTVLFFFLHLSLQAQVLLDSDYLKGCTPLVGVPSCEGKIHITANGGHGLDFFPSNIQGLPEGTGHDQAQSAPESILSLGNGGFITLKFEKKIYPIEGPEIRIFENAFYIFNPELNQADREISFTELAYVEVSQDGVNFYRFQSKTPKNYVQEFYNNPYNIDQLAGVFPSYASDDNAFETQVYDQEGKRILGEGPGGDDFDLNQLSVKLDWIQYIRIVDANLDYNDFGNQYPSASAAGFDLDAVVGLQ